MNVSMEFLSDEPIENVITSINYKIDKVIFFGHFDTIQKNKRKTVKFLKKRCGVKDIIFRPMSQTDLQAITKIMRQEVLGEIEQGNKVFFDITGGENLILVAFGIISAELQTPMHIYDVEKNKFIKLTEESTECIFGNAVNNNINFDLDQYVEMQGGIINEKRQKKCKMSEDIRFKNDFKKMWKILIEDVDSWNGFSNFLKKSRKMNDGLSFEMDKKAILEILHKNGRSMNELEELNIMLNKCSDAAILENMEITGEIYKFEYKNDTIKECLCDAGSILEIKTYWDEKEKSGCLDCRIGVHLDWDGVIQAEPAEDVLNEIDVLTLSGFVPTFISCKNGRVTQESLYELETVANRFGGKYGKKKIVTSHKLPDTILLRAEEMGIDIYTYEQ